MALTTYDPNFTTQAESVQDYENRIDAEDTPFSASIGTGNGRAKREDWPEIAYRAAKDNAAAEDGAAPAAAPNLAARIANYMQIFSDTASVTLSSDEVRVYGVANMSRKQIMEEEAGQRRDIENAFVGLYTVAAADGNAVAPTDPTAFKDTTREAGYENGAVPGRCASIHGMIDTDLQYENAGTPRALTEALILTANSGIHSKVRAVKSRICMVKPADMLVVADFANKADGSRIRDSQTLTRLVNVIREYETPFGLNTIVPNTHIAPESCVIYDPALVEMLSLVPMKFDKVDAGTIKVLQYEVVSECTLALRNSGSAAYIGDLN